MHSAVLTPSPSASHPAPEANPVSAVPARFRGLYRTENGKRVRVIPDQWGWLWSEALQVWFGLAEPGVLWVSEPDGAPVPDDAQTRARIAAVEQDRELARQQAARAEQEWEPARQRAEAEPAARPEAEAELTALRRELARLQSGKGDETR